MSRISRYRESITRFIKTKSCYSDLIKGKDNKNFDDIVNLNEHDASIILLTVLNGQYKKRNVKSHHGYYMASGIDLMFTVAMINDNMKYYEDTFGISLVKKLLTQSPIYIIECLTQNIEVLENVMEKEKIPKIHKKIQSYLHKKILDLTYVEPLIGTEKMHKLDVVKHKFSNVNLVNGKYRKLKAINKETLMNYVSKTYGSVCQCAFVFGWLLGLGEEKMIPNLEKLGTHLAMIIKLSNDFKNLERDIEHSNTNSTTYNFVANYGIHECFKLFDESKIKLLEGCMTLDIYNITIKEIIDNIEKIFDDKLKNTDLELVSKYSSFSSI